MDDVHGALCRPSASHRSPSASKERWRVVRRAARSWVLLVNAAQHTNQGAIMGAKGEALAKQFEAKVAEATALLEKLSDADWKKSTAAEKWTVAVAAHHVARSYDPITHIIKTIRSEERRVGKV